MIATHLFTCPSNFIYLCSPEPIAIFIKMKLHPVFLNILLYKISMYPGWILSGIQKPSLNSWGSLLSSHVFIYLYISSCIPFICPYISICHILLKLMYLQLLEHNKQTHNVEKWKIAKMVLPAQKLSDSHLNSSLCKGWKNSIKMMRTSTEKDK